MSNGRHKSISIGITDLSFHRVAASLVTNILKIMGFEVNRLYSTYDDNFHNLRSGKIDMLATAWLPHSHANYKADVDAATKVVELGNLFEPQLIWGVPEYVPANEVDQISDLLKQNVANKMIPTIQSVCNKSEISKYSVDLIKKYQLQESGYRFFTGTEECCYNAFEQAAAKKEWIIVPLWKPHFLHKKYSIREIKDPNGTNNKDKAVLLLR